MGPKIAIIYTTFLRPNLAKKTTTSILNNWRHDFMLLIGDQDGPIKFFLNERLFGNMRSEYTALPFDCGVSVARNTLVQRAMRMGIKYCLLTADSIEFIPETVDILDKAIKYLELGPRVGILGFGLNNRVPWEFYMDIHDGRFILTKDNNGHVDSRTGLYIKNCDICRQFFIAKTETLHSVQWDDKLKTADHEDFFWRYKRAGYIVRWTPDIHGNYIDCKPIEYKRYRNRMYKEFRQVLLKKYNLTDWVEHR